MQFRSTLRKNSGNVLVCVHVYIYEPVCTHMLALCVPAYFFLMSYISVDKKILFKMFSSNILHALWVLIMMNCIFEMQKSHLWCSF